MINKLVTFGCGWTAGNELDDPTTTAYPALIAEHFGWELEVFTEAEPTLTELLLAFTSWCTTATPEQLEETLVIVGLTDENRGNPADDPHWSDTNIELTVEGFDHIANHFHVNLLQFNVLTRQHKLKYPTMIESSSALEMLVIRDKPRKDPLFTEHKFPNEKGHTIISEFLIKQVDSVILNE